MGELYPPTEASYAMESADRAKRAATDAGERIARLEALLIKKGLVTPEELTSRS